MEKVRLGIIGLGNMGSGHAQNILAGKCPEIVITAVADRRESRRQWAKETLPEGSALPTTSIPPWLWRLLTPDFMLCAKSLRVSTPRLCGR